MWNLTLIKIKQKKNTNKFKHRHRIFVTIIDIILHALFINASVIQTINNLYECDNKNVNSMKFVTIYSIAHITHGHKYTQKEKKKYMCVYDKDDDKK